MYPLSYGQEQMWLVDQMLGPAALAAPALCTRITGALDVGALRQATAYIVDRHSVLRARFLPTPAGCEQRVVSAPPLDFDLTDLPDAGQAAAACAEEIRRGFDLTRDPPLRARVYRIAADDHVLLVLRHHIVWDGESDEIFAAELGALYRQFAGGAAADLPPLALQYPDFARRQREEVSGQRLEKLVTRARDAIGDPLPEPLPLGGPGGRGEYGYAHVVPIAPAVGDRIPEFAQEAQATPYMMLLGVFRAWWSVGAGVDRLLIGCPISGRRRPEYQDLIGYFSNLAVVGHRVDASITPHEVIARERRGLLEAMTRHDLPYEVLARSLGRSASRPLVQVAFLYEATPWPDLMLPGLGTGRFDFDAPNPPPPLDLMVTIGPHGDGLAAKWEHRDPLLSETVRAMAASFDTMLARAIEHPGTPIGRLDVPRAEPATTARADTPQVTWLTADTGTPPGSRLEQEIADTWSELLGRAVPGVHANLFSLGGHSLTVATLAFRLAEAYGLPVPMADLMEHPTVAGQAALIERQLATALDRLDEAEIVRVLDQLATETHQ
ncbi:hypothetical protein Aph01nite_70770 [Acrocarpospora phusangensis]|uniref:Carrier domain-containing protein n=1 Tax=Acrocarpospora phusangensis TaxID=1070424 RepID=A0A919QMB7_9ACTN|nr:condensation domain-containing protein [Acrocarpospora phusangensis]GIH28767.1 hypothetical protein Aph01nite_70770 [Acrocarpospora phusangensis]